MNNVTTTTTIPRPPSATRFRVVRHHATSPTAWILGAEVRRNSMWHRIPGEFGEWEAIFTDARHPQAAIWARASEVVVSDAIL